MNKYKGLIIGRNPINLTTGNGKTVATFLRRFDSDCLANLYVTNLPTDMKICKRYFRIDEKDILNVPFFESKTGVVKENLVLCEKGIFHENSIIKAVKSILNAKVFLLLRSMLWKKEKWLSKELKQWIDDFSPDFLFYDVGNLPYEYDKIIELKKMKKIPLIIYISDDYVYDSTSSIGWKGLYYKRMRKSFKNLSEQADLCIVISEAMKHKFEKRVDCKMLVAMNGPDKLQDCMSRKNDLEKNLLVYAGNVGLGRWKILLNVNAALEKLQKEGLNFKLNIYSSFLIPKGKKKEMEKKGLATCCGSVFGDELNKVRADADILLHVESFDKKYQTILSTALSTKIPEYMMLGRPILVIAPDYAEAGNFLKRNMFGTVVNTKNKNGIAEAIRSIIQDKDRIMAMSEQAQVYAFEKMSGEYVSKTVHDKIMQICSEFF